MRSSPPPSTAGIFSEALGLGCSLGLVHAIVESILLGLNDIRPSMLDLAILAGTSIGAGALLAVCLAVAARVPALQTILGTNHGPLAFRRTAWSIFIAGYLLVFVKIISFWSGWKSALLWSLAAAPSVALACFAVFRKGQRVLIPACASALVAATLCALQLHQADWGHEPASPDVFAARLLIPIGLCLALLLAVMRATSPEKPFEPITRAAGALVLLVAAWAGFWMSLHSDKQIWSLFGGASAAATTSRPNVLLIVLDTVRADHLDLFGYDRQTMPNLARFAREDAQVANRTFTPASWTLPSHASMFTGRYPSAHGAHYPFVSDPAPAFLAYSLPEDVPTLAEFLGGMGFQTGAVAANYAMLSQFGLSRGFQHYDVTPGPAYFASKILWLYRVHIGLLPSLGEMLQRSLPAALQGQSRMFSVREPYVRRAWEINTLAQRWLNQQGRRPFFLFLNYMDAHAPYMPIAEDDERFVKRPAGEDWFGFPTERYSASVRGMAKFTTEEIEFMKGQYDAGLVSLDRELGRLFDYLKQAGLFENTLIFITGDHGEAFFEHGFPEHGNSAYQPEIDGLLLIKAPASLGPVNAGPMMQAVDIFPTVASAMNEPSPPGVQGTAWGQGRDYALSEVFCRSCGWETSGGLRWPDAFRRDLVAVMIGGQKLIRSTHGPDEVYDLTADPLETKPLADPDPQFLQRAGEIIAERNEHMVEGLSKRPEDNILLEKLRSLGYIQ
jgi:arylsulfatase A-like enzyme